MTTYARIVSGYALDCQVAATATELSARFHPDWLTANPFTVVPDGTIHGAKDNGDGTFTNPTPVIPAVVYALISASEFQETCEAAFGGGSVGATRFGKVMRDMSASADDLVFSVYQRFVKSITFDRTKTSLALHVLQSATIITGAERTAILNGWRVV